MDLEGVGADQVDAQLLLSPLGQQVGTGGDDRRADTTVPHSSQSFPHSGLVLTLSDKLEVRGRRLPPPQLTDDLLGQGVVVGLPVALEKPRSLGGVAAVAAVQVKPEVAPLEKDAVHVEDHGLHRSQGKRWLGWGQR